MRTLPRLLFLLFFSSVLGCQQIQSQYLHPKIANKTVTVRSAVILPAKVELTKVSAKEKINVLKSPFDNKSGALDEDRKYTLANLQARYDALLPKLVNKSKDVKKGRFSLGDEVMVLNVDKSADALIFIRGQGRVFTKGKTAFSILNPFSMDLPVLFITVGIVDAHTGEVLVFTKPLAASKVVKDPKKLNKLIKSSLKKLPASA